MKLDEIQYGQVSLPRGISPSAARGEAQFARTVGNVVQGTLQFIADKNRDYDLTMAKTRTSSDIANFEQRFANREGYSAQEVRDLGLEDEVRTTEGEDDQGNPIDREFIPRFEVYPLLKEQAWEKAIARNGAAIRNDQDQDKWRSQMSLVRDQNLSDTVARAQNEAMEYALKSQQMDIIEAQRAGNFDGARDLIEVAYQNNPNAMREQLYNNRISKEQYLISGRLMSEDPEQIDDLLDRISSDEYIKQSALDADTLRKYYAAGITRRNAIYNKQEEQRKLYQDELSNQHLINIVTGQPGAMAAVIEDEAELGTANFRYLMAQARAMATESDSFSTAPGVRVQFEVAVANIESGNYEGDFYEQVDNLRNWLLSEAYSVDELTGQVQLGISGTDVNTWRRRLNELEAKPLETESYKAIVQELQQRILRGSKEMINFGAVDAESSNLYAEAMSDLRAFVQDQGGIKADLVSWRRERMPYYLSESSRRSFIRLPLRMREEAIFTPAGDRIDATATREVLKNNYRQATNADDKALMRQDIATFDAWAANEGQYYVTN